MRDNMIIDLRSDAPVHGSGHPNGNQVFDSLVSFAHGLAAQAPKARRDYWRRRMQSRVDAMIKSDHGRRDSFSPQAGFHFTRDLEHIYDEVLREPFPAPNALELFYVDGTVPVGNRTHTVRRVYQDGEAAFYRKGQKVQRASVSRKEQEFPIRYAVTAFGYSLFEKMSSDVANSDLHGENLRAARDILAEFLNLVFWYGHAETGMYGITNYPWLPKKVVGTAFTDDSDPRDVLAELNNIANFSHEKSLSTLQSDTLVMSPRLHNFLSTRPWSPLATDGKTILTVFLENQKRITAVEEAWELQEVGPGSTDGIFAYKRDRRGVAVVPVGGPFNMLPPQEVGFSTDCYCWAGCGGVIMRDVGANVLAWVTPPATS